MNDIQKEIILTLMHQPGMRFNELWQKNDTSSKFAYHIKTLEENDLIRKDDEKYYLTANGKKTIAYYDGRTGNKTLCPIPSVMLYLIQDNKLLMQERTKEPHFGLWGVPCGKVEFDQHPFEAAKKELFDETHLSADFELKGMMCARTFIEDGQAYNHQLHILHGSNITGDLVPMTREGKNAWIPIDKIASLKTYPDIQLIFDAIQTNKYTYFETDRYLNDGTFTELKIVQKHIVA